jgi:hypothetical protein
MRVPGDKKRTGDFAIERGENGMVGFGKISKMTVGSLLGSSNPLGEMRDVAVVRYENPADSIAALYLEQEFASLRDGRAILLSLPQHTHEA